MLEEIKIYRLYADLSWGDLAKKIGMTAQYAKQVFGGQAKPRGGRTMAKIKRFYIENEKAIKAAVSIAGAGNPPSTLTESKTDAGSTGPAWGVNTKFKQEEGV